MLPVCVGNMCVLTTAAELTDDCITCDSRLFLPCRHLHLRQGGGSACEHCDLRDPSGLTVTLDPSEVVHTADTHWERGRVHGQSKFKLVANNLENYSPHVDTLFVLFSSRHFVASTCLCCTARAESHFCVNRVDVSDRSRVQVGQSVIIYLQVV